MPSAGWTAPSSSTELVVWKETRLAFERLTQRLHRRGAAAQRAAAVWRAHYVAFDLLHLDGRSLLERPYVERRYALEDLFRREGPRRPGRCARQPMMRRWPAGGWPGQQPAWRAVCSRTAAKANGQGRAPGGSSACATPSRWSSVRSPERRTAPGSCCSAGTTRRDDCDIWDVQAPCQPPRPGARAASYARCRRITRGPGGPSLPVGDHSRS
ncbi:hypothetical protein U5640_12045 [Streptomyces sp. SS7]|uniref:ATP-dependent DNA ligase n=1 Tax=Streptomyces sp. SS7 TaxID=3108485 RepID=UPI0030ED6399